MDNLIENKNKITSYFKELPPFKQTARIQYLAKEDSLWKNTIPLINKNFIYGIEIEMENIQHELPKLGSDRALYWNFVEDHSLRNLGIECVSLPLRAHQIEFALDQLNYLLAKEQPDFSPRTSLHVHMNVRDLTMEQIVNLVILYTAVENVLFNWVGHNRDKNIFCIKLTETYYAKVYAELLNDPHRALSNWCKYTSLNLLPIVSKGTVEFRHMHGTKDKEKIITWINMLSCLKLKAKTSSPKELFTLITDLNSSSYYESFLKDVFGIYAEDLLSTLNTKHLQEELEDTISYLKLVTCISKKKESTSKPYRVDDFIHPPVPIENLAIRGVPEEARPNRPQNQERFINNTRRSDRVTTNNPVYITGTATLQNTQELLDRFNFQIMQDLDTRNTTRGI